MFIIKLELTVSPTKPIFLSANAFIFVLLSTVSCGGNSQPSNSERPKTEVVQPTETSEEAVPVDNVPQKLALLVGINEYEMVSDLEGCVNDVELMESLLAKKFGFNKSKISKLTDENATREGIITAFQKHLVSNARPGDIVVFYYSGHGAQVRDLGRVNQEEADQLEEILVPHDFEDKPSLPFKGISDDEINGLLKLVTNITDNVTFIFDACHSAGTTKSLDLIKKIEVRPRILPEPADFAVSSRGFRNSDAKYAFIAGCKSDQYSYEMRISPNGKPQGALTYNFVSELFRRSGKVSYSDIIGNVRNNVKAQYPGQYPELLGTSNDKQVFGVEDLLPMKHAKVHEINGTVIKIDAGAILGVTKGSEFEVYEPTENLRSKDRKSIASIRIIKVNAFDAEAQVINGNVTTINSQAVEVRHNFESLVLNIFYEGDWTHLADLRNKVNSLPYAQQVNSKSDADILMVNGNESIELFLGFDLNLPKEKFTDLQNHNTILEEIEKWASWFSAILIDNPDSELSIDVSMEATGDPKGAKGISDLLSNTDYVFRNNQGIDLHVKNKNEVPIYVHLLDIIDDGSIESLCLEDFELGVDLIQPGETATIPLTATLNGDKDAKEVIKVIASTNGEINLNYLSLGCYNDQNGNKKHVEPRRKGAGDVNSWVVVNKVIEVKR